MKIGATNCVFADVDGKAPNLNEPWAVLAHKKPQAGWVVYNPKIMRPPPLQDATKKMKIMSWNVNGLRALLKLESFSALELAQKEDFDVLCLQETKLQARFMESCTSLFLPRGECSTHYLIFCHEKLLQSLLHESCQHIMH